MTCNIQGNFSAARMTSSKLFGIDCLFINVSPLSDAAVFRKNTRTVMHSLRKPSTGVRNKCLMKQVLYKFPFICSKKVPPGIDKLTTYIYLGKIPAGIAETNHVEKRKRLIHLLRFLSHDAQWCTGSAMMTDTQPCLKHSITIKGKNQ